MRRALIGAALAMGAALLPTSAHAAWPMTIEVELCWFDVCDGTFTEWTLRRDGTFVDDYGSTGTFYWRGFYATWPYNFDFIAFYDNGVATYIGDISGGEVTGTMSSNAFPPYTVEGTFCSGGC